MDISFVVMNTTSSVVDLKIDGRLIQSEYVSKDQSVKMTLTEHQINNSELITIENSDIVYDVTQNCKSKLKNTPKQVVIVPPPSDTSTNIKTHTESSKEGNFKEVTSMRDLVRQHSGKG